MATIIYSVRVSIKKNIESDWIEYMKKHILDVVNTQCFKDYFIRKIIPADFISADGNKDDDFSTYIIEYHANSMQKLKEYFLNYAESLQKDHPDKFNGQFTASRAIMQDQFETWFELMPIGNYKLPDDML